MTFLAALFLDTFDPSIVLPEGILGWTGWLAFLALTAGLLWHWRSHNRPLKRGEWVLAILLAAAAPLTSLLVGVRLPVGNALPVKDVISAPVGAALMIFSALPWMLAGGLLGPLAAAGIGLLAGLAQAAYDTHSLFTPLETAFLAVLFSVAVQQRYRTRLYAALRQPLIAAGLLALIYPLLSMTLGSFAGRGLLANRLDFAITHLPGVSIAVAVEFIFAGLVATMIARASPLAWGNRTPLQPAPYEISLQSRFLYSILPVAAALVLLLMVGAWFVAGTAASQMIETQMASVAKTAGDSIPYYHQAGQALIGELASDSRLSSAKDTELRAILENDLNIVPFFNQLFVIDLDDQIRAGFPQSEFAGGQLSLDEQVGVDLARNGVSIQSYTIPPAPQAATTRTSFIAPVLDAQGKARAVLIGQTNLNTNPFMLPVLNSLSSLAGSDGVGLVLDENDRIIYAPTPDLLMTQYTGQTGNGPLFYEDTANNGTRQMVYYRPSDGQSWAVALTIPAYRAQQIALGIALPLAGMILLLAAVSFLILRWGIRRVTGSLQQLSTQAGSLAQGELDQPVTQTGEDEVGQLRRSFERMRVSLKARLDELNRLLLVSQGVASSLEMSESVRQVLESAVGAGGASARIVLVPAVVPDLEGDETTPAPFSAGRQKERFAYLDDQILVLTRTQDRLVISNPGRTRLLHFPPGLPRPEALIAVALRHENQYYGALWLAYDQPHPFQEDEVRFIVTLAGQAALAAANTRLFLNAEIGRQRLAAILASSPDPILVTDQHDRLLLANPAAWQVFGMGLEAEQGQSIEQMIQQPELIQLLRANAEDKPSIEVTLPGERVFLATASTVFAEGQRVGRVCTLRDITHFKELDALKSEFVSTVSHDLRSPLTLMRGYATMLEMVGQLNDQQVGYVRKIIGGVDSMSRLVTDLLDLGRIDAGIGLQLELISVQDIVERVVGALQLQASQKHIQMTTEIVPGVTPLIEADPALLQQALQNLVENAVKYTRHDGKVAVRVYNRAEQIVFEISDTGIGISPMDQPRLFEKFYRGAQNVSKEQRGAGLGLSIVKSIADRHSGEVGVESQLGKGSTFLLSIPIRQGERLGLDAPGRRLS
jgi:PAS domain S-box-containing protein